MCVSIGSLRKCVVLLNAGAVGCVCAEEQEQEDGSPVASVTSCGGQGQRVDPWEMVIITAISMIKPL